MLDAHVHIERGSYTRDWVDRFVEFAVRRGISTLRLLEHSHRFSEFFSLYEEVRTHPVHGTYNREWLATRGGLPLAEYRDFVARMRQEDFPVRVEWGLEVCYFPGKEELIRELTSDFEWDFVTGSVHWIDGWGFDHPSRRDSWLTQSVDQVYRDYYRIMIQLVESRLFTTLAHPDSIKCFSSYPTADLTPVYTELARLLSRTGTAAELSAGLKLNYGHPEMGVNRRLLEIFREHGVKLVTASDAHRPEDVGRFVMEMTEGLSCFSNLTEMKLVGREAQAP